MCTSINLLHLQYAYIYTHVSCIYIYIYIDYSLGRPNPRLGETERLAVPNEFSRPEAAFSNVFSSASPCRTSFFQRLAVPKELFRACSRREGALRVPRATLERLGSVLERPWSVKRAPRDPESEHVGVKRAPGESKREPQSANRRRQETKNELKETLERRKRRSVRRLERNREC